MSRAKTNGSKSPTSGQPVTQAPHYPLSPHRPRRRHVRIDTAVRRRIEDAIERMIEVIDAVDETEAEGQVDDGPIDGNELEHDESDDEPSLGASDQTNQERAWNNCGSREDLEEQNEDGDELDRDEASDLEIYGEADSDDGRSVDEEPSLGSLDGRMSQKRWGSSDREGWYCIDAEHDEAEHEVSDEEVSEGGIEDLNHDGDTLQECGVNGPSIPNANDAFGGVA
jgi:hypothetical protein